MKRQTGISSDQEELATESPGSGSTTVDQGAAGVDPWPVLASIDTTGLALESKQDVGNASLASIDTKLTSPVTVTGPLTDVQLRASAVPVSAASLPLPTNAAQETGGNLATIAGKDFATQTTLALIKVKTDNLDVALSTKATETTLGTRLSESDFDTKIGSLTETAPGTDTASSGLNGRLQRIAQRLTSLITALGSPFQAGGSIGNTTFASTVADGANVALGVVSDAAVTAGATGTISAKLRSISRDLVANIVLAAGTNTIGNVGVVPLTSGGCSNYHVVSAASTNTANIKASAGQIYSVSVFNNVGYPVYVKFHNTAGTPTAGTGVVFTLGVQAGSERTFSLPAGLTFATGIGISIVKDITDAGTTAVAASDCVVDVSYK